MLHVFAVFQNFRVLRKACAIWLCARNITAQHLCQVDVPENLLSSAGGGGTTFHDRLLTLLLQCRLGEVCGHDRKIQYMKPEAAP